jgi:hypothetical protein
MDVRKTPDNVAYALVAAANQRQVDGISTFFHLNRTETTDSSDYRAPTVTRMAISAAVASNEATLVALANELKADINTHFADTIAHNTAVSSAVATAAATNTATANTLLNALKAAYNTHLSAANVHYTNDATNTIAAADATNEATGITLANELKTDFTAHIASAPAGTYIRLIDA